MNTTKKADGTYNVKIRVYHKGGSNMEQSTLAAIVQKDKQFINR